MRSGVSLLFGGALVASAAWAALGGGGKVSTQSAAKPFSCTVASITDGDTLRCAETGSDGKQLRVRLSGMAARERDGSCTIGHPCPDATAEDATAMLVSLSAGEVLSCKPVGKTFGRVAAFCSTSAGVDLSCAMVASGTAARWDRYWQEHSC